MSPSIRRLRVALSLSLLAIVGCAHAGRPAPDPHVTAPTLQAAAVACAAHGFAYVAHVDGQRYYCTLTNPLNEPEAVPVAPLIEGRP